MQPTYLPWIGYFGLILSADLFVLLDNVQFARRSWQQRNQIKTVQGSRLLTIPVKKKGMRSQLINQVEFSDDTDFINDHLTLINHSYYNCPFFDPYYFSLSELYFLSSPLLIDFTVPIIRFICNSLAIHTPIITASSLNINGVKDEYLYNICKELGASNYISPPGSKNYLDLSPYFKSSNINVSYFLFDHPSYTQQYGKFLPYMSCIDLLFNCGPLYSKQLILSSSSLSIL
ncbi:WbqC family protein [Prochlorococcus marinus]|uniref:WbqC family protein n=1 Tax=Prochlorococcus marinus TaxID=1219 RepID=UPI0007BBF7CA|nr:WbqC family protein [Prochlorococcus marinus]KZR73707.1 WbqC-like protein family protein [Prochlorococcus marinus str. MIT 1320]